MRSLQGNHVTLKKHVSSYTVLTGKYQSAFPYVPISIIIEILHIHMYNCTYHSSLQLFLSFPTIYSLKVHILISFSNSISENTANK